MKFKTKIKIINLKQKLSGLPIWRNLAIGDTIEITHEPPKYAQLSKILYKLTNARTQDSHTYTASYLLSAIENRVEYIQL